jgi:cytochrome P450
METTASSVANALVLLAAHPDQHRRLAANLTSVDLAVEEVLRFEAPVQVTKRFATREVVVQGTTIPEGADVFLVLASGNRDESRYERPDDFDIRRDPLRHLAFGDGIHHCLGAPLARLELRILLEELCEAGDSLTLEGPARRLNSNFIRGYAELSAALS